MNPQPLSFWDQVELLLLRLAAALLVPVDRLFNVQWGERVLTRMTVRWEERLATLDEAMAELDRERQHIQDQTQALAIHTAAVYLGGRCLTHDEARSRNARGRLAFVRHGRAASCDEKVVDALRHDDAVRDLIKAARAPFGEKKLDVTCDVRFYGPAVDADRIVEVAIAQDVVLTELIFAKDPARFANADLRCDLGEDSTDSPQYRQRDFSCQPA